MRMTSKGQVTIPLDIRETLDLVPSSEIEFVRENGRIRLRNEPPEHGADHGPDPRRDPVSEMLVDANVLTEDPVWFDGSTRTLEGHAALARRCINPLIYAEVSFGFERSEELDEALPPAGYTHPPLPWEADYLAGKTFVRYRRDGGQRRSPLPHLLIDARAAIAGLSPLTRGVRRYRSYFPAPS